MHDPNLKFKKKKKFILTLFGYGRLHPKKPVPYKTGQFRKKKPVLYKTGQEWFDEAVRTSRGSEPVGPADFTSSGSVLVTLVPPTAISLNSTKQCRKVISHTGKFFFFVICAQSERKVAATSMASATGISMQQKQVNKVMEEYKYIFSSPTEVPLHCQVKHSSS
jgi:hypothetical protein